MENYSTTVCILTAGTGSRMGPFSNIINKSLLPIYNKAIISHLIEAFPENTNFIIALGYKGFQVKNYLELMHNNINFKYIEVDNFESKGSGPAYSLNCCKAELQKPFFFLASDGYYENIPLDVSSDWLGLSNVNNNEEDYCNVGFDNQSNIVSDICDKRTPPKISKLNYKVLD